MNPLYIYPTRINYYDLDFRGKVRLSALLRMVHIAADVNAREHGAGYDALAPLGMTFVLQRFGVSILRMPSYNEEIVIRTWPSGTEKGTFLRRGDMYDAKGEKIMEWASLWLLFDINERRPLKPTELPVELVCLGDEGVQVKPEKVSLPTDWGKPFHSYNHTVSYRDVDTNMHMNNSIYGDLIGDAIFPISAFASEKSSEKSIELRRIQINYLAEMRLGAEVSITTHNDGNKFIVSGESSGRRSFIARVDTV